MSAPPPPPLPAEVVRLILDGIDTLRLSDVVSASHVSHTWRVAARSHPLYARDISLRPRKPLSHGAVLFFLDRLAALPGGNLELTIRVAHGMPRNVCEDPTAKHNFRTLVIPALKQSLPRLVTLTIVCDEDLIPDTIAALCTGAAPRLREFTFCASGDYEPSVLPQDLFAGHAPLLRELQMDAFQFPAAHPVPALASVRILARYVPYDLSVAALHPERFFVNCPALEELYIAGDMVDLTCASWSACPPPSVTKLQRLTVTNVDGDPSTEIVVRTFMHPGMQSIDVDICDLNAETVEFMIGTLHDSKAPHLDILGHDCKLAFSVFDAARSWRRTFTHWYEYTDMLELEIEVVLLPSFTGIAHRFTHISLSEHKLAWDCMLVLFPEESLVGVQTLKAKLSLPALAEIKLVAETRADIDADDLVFLVENMIDVPTERRLGLGLKNVRIRGVLPSGFENVSPLGP
ncbi:hypothetical protein AURDEDRAFT_174072 [Auricularia subglabra TFB-10046 SS5]|nr:hypothetical protein AURDEDRAFT_174072 [Auricularia subglabra TFB-10046 SS5]